MGKGGGIGGFRGGKLEQLGGSGCGPCGWASAWWNPAAQSHQTMHTLRRCGSRAGAPQKMARWDGSTGVWSTGAWTHGSTGREHVDHAAARRADVAKVPGVHRWVLAKVSAVELQRAVAAHAVLRVVVRVRVVVQPVRKTSGLRPRPAGSREASLSTRSCLRLCPELRSASANPPLGTRTRWPAPRALLSTWPRTGCRRAPCSTRRRRRCRGRAAATSQ